MNNQYIYPIVDLWRAIAVLLVVSAHTLLWFENPIFFKYFEPSLLGTTGVAIFFVLTSYVLMFSMDRIKEKSKYFYIDFINRRFFRIYPLAIFIIIIYGFFSIPSYDDANGQVVIYGLNNFDVFIQNILLIQNFTRVDEIVEPMWSLPYEFQMYLVLPIIFLFFITKDKKIQGLFMFFILCLAFFVAHSKIENINEKLVYFQIPSYAKWGLCFIPGVVAYYVQKDVKITKINFSYFVPIIILILLSRMLNYNFFIQVFSAILVGFTLVVLKDDFNGLIKKTAFIISKYSYGIYLTHTLSIFIGFHVVGNSFLGWVTFIVTLIVFPLFCYHLIEKPFINFGKSISIKYFER